jgi:hypothetical protein
MRYPVLQMLVHIMRPSSLKVALRSALLYDCTELMSGSVTDLQYCENIFAMSELSRTGDEVILS